MSAQKLNQAENRLFLQIKSARILDILRAFLIRKIILLALVGYEPTHSQRALLE